MKKTFLLILLSLPLFAANTYFTTAPSPSPDGSKIVFSYDNDIWVVNSTGGQAYRLTGMDGMESEPLYSPDGKWIAFTGRQDGNANVYVMPAEGGEIKQLTFYDRDDVVESWSWDSKTVYFSSNRYNDKTTFKVSVTGGTPERLFENYFNWPHNLVADPNQSVVYFNTSWESFRFPMRKKYVGPFNSDIQSYNFDTKEYKKLTDYEGKDQWATIDKNGNLYYASVEYNEEYNLYKFENGSSSRLTDFNSSIKRPRVSADGSIVVFEKDYQIYLYNTASKKTSIVNVALYRNNTLSLEKEFDTGGKISAFDVSPDNKKIAFVSRGELFVSDIEGKFIKNLNTDKTERVTEVNWLKDNKTILYTQTVNGWLNLFTIEADQNSTPKKLTDDKQTDQRITLNSDRTKAVYHSGRNELRVLDLESFKSETVVKDEFWGLYAEPAYFSPDDKYIVYTAQRNFEGDIFVYDIEKKESKHITKTGVSESSPYWSPDGKYIYFVSDPFEPSYPRGSHDDEIYRVALQNLDDDYKSDEYDKLFVEEKKDSSKPAVKIDFEDLDKRWEAVANQPMNQSGVYVFQKDEKTYVFYTSSHDSEGRSVWLTTYEPFKSKETKKIEGAKGNDFSVIQIKDKYYLRMDNDIYKLDVSSHKADKISISEKFSRDLKDEFTQMFYEAWASLDENYYDENFHGTDWEKVRDYYAGFLPYIENRENLRTVFSDMLGELNSSHLGLYSNGDEEKTYYEYSTAVTGVLFQNENPYTVERIIDESPASKGSKDIQKGDVLLKVNGVQVDKSVNRESYFRAPSMDDEMELTFSRGTAEYSVKIKPVNSGQIINYLYDEWIETNQERVDKESNKRIAYIYMKDMTDSSLRDFQKETANEWPYKDALILDIRYNRGGNVHDEVLNTLSRVSYLQWKYRGGALTPQPNFPISDKPIILLTNEQSLSDAEMTATGFKALKLGKIIGNGTYRWIIFTSATTLVDGSVCRLPSWGCYTLSGDDIEQVGVTPDILIINTFKDRVEGNDPQLDKAILLMGTRPGFP